MEDSELWIYEKKEHYQFVNIYDIFYNGGKNN